MVVVEENTVSAHCSAPQFARGLPCDQVLDVENLVARV